MATKKSDQFDVVLEKIGNQPLKTTKVLCQMLGLGLAVAKGMVDKAPTIVAKGIDREKAITLRNELEAIGNTASIPGINTKTVATTVDKDAEAKKPAENKSVPTSLTVTVPRNDQFDAIFGSDEK